MNVYPTDLSLTAPDTLSVTWNDGTTHRYAVGLLRDRCPCATCRERQKADSQPTDLLPVLRLEETEPLRIVSMRPVGNYAYSIGFSDGHDTGIFTLEFLHELGEAGSDGA